MENQISSESNSNIKGLLLQKLRAAFRLLTSLSEEKKSIVCTIEYVDDVFMADLNSLETKYFAEQNKSYESSKFTMNSHAIQNSLRIFFDNWFENCNMSNMINFTFYTNTTYTKERASGVLSEEELPEKPIIEYLIEKDYSKILELFKKVFSKYYIEQHEKHTENIQVYIERLENLSDEKWINFLDLIEWNFGETDEVELRKDIDSIVLELCKSNGVNTNLANAISAEIIDMIEKRTFENDFLSRVVHVSEIKLLFLEKVTITETKVVNDPVHSRWDEVDCDKYLNLRDKFQNVCHNYCDYKMMTLLDEYTDGVFEQKSYYDAKAIKAYNYRIYKKCKNLLETKYRLSNESISADEIDEIITGLIEESNEIIKDKAQTYNFPFKDKDMIRKSVLLLFEECYINFVKEV